jgi:hypothetical protein
MRQMKCIGYCEQGALATHYDPKDPPLDVEKCLCAECFICHADEVLEELQERIDALQAQKDSASLGS